MDHGRYGQPAFISGNPTLHFHPRIPSLVSEVPFYMHQVLNPNAPPPPHTFRETTTIVSPPPPPPPSQTGWNALNGSAINLNHGTTNYAQNTTATIRWPRQETLTLLEIRSRLDPCFKEANSPNLKAPLWDEISRIMNEEYGYQRSGRKCKEKFENLYKYYKKTKEGKVGKHDGKHYRFFRQLEALFGDQLDLRGTNTNIAVYSQSNYSSEYGTPSISNEKKGRYDHYEFDMKEFIVAIEESIESHLKKLMVKQDQWGERILCTIERNDHERVVREEEWRKIEGARLDHEYGAWASHVARIEARDKSLLDALHNLIRVKSIGKEKETLIISSTHEKQKDWIEPEISSLIQIRANKQHGERIWEEVAFELSLLGYNRSENDCKEAWEKICVDFNKMKMECEYMSKEVSLRTSNSIEQDDRNNRVHASTMNIDDKRSWETM